MMLRTIPSTTLRRRFYVYDAVEMHKSEGHCPRCGSMLYEDSYFGPCCLNNQACGWQWRYPRGTTERADGTLISADA